MCDETVSHQEADAPMRLVRPIAFIGFMGSGKSSVAAELAERLSAPLIDIDQEIEASSGLSIAEIFEHHGEPYFRKLESELLEDALANDEPAIIACGGGIVLDDHNAELLEEGALVIYLQVTAEEVVRRLEGDTRRPLLAGFEEPGALSAFIGLRERFYDDLADICIETTGRTVTEVVEHITRCIKESEYGAFHA